MIYQMRLRDGQTDPQSSGTFVARDGRAQPLARADFQITPRRFWTSAKTGARYPIGWELAVPSLGLRLEVSTPLPAQELALEGIAYWEGAVDARGTRDGRAIAGQGYLELTGYAGPLPGLSETNARPEPGR